jgi:DNA-binding response OmpR family regulator
MPKKTNSQAVKKAASAVAKKEKNIASILLVEDDTFLSSMYKTKLEIEGYQVYAALNGESGLKMAQEKKPNLILLDIILPKMNGFEVLEKIKSDKNLKHIPVIMLTNLGQKEDIKKSFKLGANEYLIKAHFLPSEVIEKVKKFLK